MVVCSWVSSRSLCWSRHLSPNWLFSLAAIVNTDCGQFSCPDSWVMVAPQSQKYCRILIGGDAVVKIVTGSEGIGRKSDSQCTGNPSTLTRFRHDKPFFYITAFHFIIPEHNKAYYNCVGKSIFSK